MSSGCLCVSCWVCTTVVSQCCLGSAARLSHSPLARTLSLTRTRTVATARRHRPLISNPVIIQKIAPRWAGGWAGGRAGAGLASVCLALAHMPLGCCSLGRLRTPWVAVAAAAAPRCTVASASPVTPPHCLALRLAAATRLPVRLVSAAAWLVRHARAPREGLTPRADWYSRGWH